MARPVDNLAIRLVRLVGTERGPANQALEHDGANGPPIAAVVVTPATEDLRGDVVGRSDRRIGKLTTGLSPFVDLSAVANSELDLVKGDRVAVLAVGLLGVTAEQLLVVGSFVLLVETRGETKVGKLDVSTAVEEDVVGFDVTAVTLVCF